MDNGSIYEITYCASSLVGTYVLCRFMRILMGDARTSKRVEMGSFMAYYVVSTLIYLLIDVPVVMLTVSILSYFLLSFNYRVDIKKRLFLIVFIYIVMFLGETLALVLTGYMKVEISTQSNYSSVLGVVLNHMIFLVFVVSFGNIKQIRQGMSIPIIYWVCLIVFPVFTIYIIMLLFYTGNVSPMSMIICIVVLLLLNISISYLYDFVVRSMMDKAEKMLLEQQNRSYIEQFEIMRSSMMATKSLRHDLKNHFVSLNHMLMNGQNETAKEYIDNIINEKMNVGSVHSGNVVVDSILSFKCQNAEKEGINVTLQAKIPEELAVASEDMVIILGNVLDNAIEAVRDLAKENRWITVEIEYDRGILLIKTSNPFEGERKRRKGWFETTKKDEENHGIGLYNVKRILEKYHGWLDMETKEGIFFSCVGLYLNS